VERSNLMYLYSWVGFYYYASILLHAAYLFFAFFRKGARRARTGRYMIDTDDTTELWIYHFLPSAFNASDLYCELGSRYGFSPIDDARSPALSSL
jgi:hypothetical protein